MALCPLLAHNFISFNKGVYFLYTPFIKKIFPPKKAQFLYRHLHNRLISLYGRISDGNNRFQRRFGICYG